MTVTRSSTGSGEPLAHAGRIRRGRRIRKWVVPTAVTMCCIALVPNFASAALLTGSYELTWDRDVDKTETETTDVRKFKQILELKYKGFLSPIVENEVTFKVEQEINSNAADTTRFLPTLDLGFKGSYWEATTGAKRTHENSDEPGKNPKVTTNYFVEFFYVPRRNIPDLKTKYTLDTDEEEGTTDTRKQEITLSSVYKPTSWMDLKGDYDRATSDDRLNPDSDTEDEKINGSAAVRHFLSDKIKMDAQYDVEISRGATLLDAGGATNQKEDRTHTFKSTLGFRPFVDTDLNGSYDYDLKQNIENGEHTHTQDIKGTVSQKIGKPFDLKGEFDRVVTEVKHSADDNRKTEDTWTVDLKAKFSKHLDFTLKYEIKDTEERHADPALDTKTGTRTKTATWNGELTPFWKASVSLDDTDTLEDDVTTVVDTKYSLKSTFDFKAVNLTLDPTYDITRKDDRLIPENTAIRDLKVKIAWKVFATRTMEGKFDHTYGRKTDTGADNIQRTDSTNANLAWTDPLPGWTFGIDLTRQATDTSEDDLAPDITSTFGFKADYKLDPLNFSSSYKYDKKSLTDDSETFDAKIGWIAPKWDATLTYTFDKTFSAALNEGYSISLAFKYNL